MTQVTLPEIIELDPRASASEDTNNKSHTSKPFKACKGLLWNCARMIADLPGNELQRLEVLRSFDLLDTPHEPEFDEFAQLASTVCGTPVALVTLIDERRQWFKASVGVDATETHGDVAFCSQAILEPGPLIVPDASLDPRFADSPLVAGDPRVRFYAGIPLDAGNGNRRARFASSTSCRAISPGSRPRRSSCSRVL